MHTAVASKVFGRSKRQTLTLVMVNILAFTNVAHAQTLGAVEQRLDRLEKVTRELQRQTDRTSRTPSSRDEVYLQLDRRLSALERSIASLISGQERDHRDFSAAIEQVHRFKGDVERRLEAVESKPQAARDLPSQDSSTRKPLTADDRFRQAMALVTAEDWLNAELAFDTFLASFPSDPRRAEARYHLARALEGQGKHARAAQIFLELYEQQPEAPFAIENLFALAEALAGLTPQDREQICGVYGEIDAAHGTDLSVEQRARLLDQRLAFQCAR